MTRVAVVGYASLDHAMALTTFNGVDATSIVQGRLSAQWPAPGGVFHHARALTQAAGVDPDLTIDAVSWVGPDDAGRRWVSALEAEGVGTAAVRTTGTRTPSSYLFYADASGTICIYDPADCHDAPLSQVQRDTLAQADWCLLCVGPESATREVLAVLGTRTRLAWAVKQDAAALPPDLVTALLARASVVSFSAGERDFLTSHGRGPEERVPTGTLVVETLGRDGVRFWIGGGATRAGSHVAAEEVQALDSTGAGDTFIGTLVAGLSSVTCPTDLAGFRPLIDAASRAATTFIVRRFAAAPSA